MKNLRIKSVQDIEKLIWMFYRYIPQPPTSTIDFLVRLYPYITVVGAGYLLSIATIPFVLPQFPLDPLSKSGLFMFNIILSRLLFAVMGTIIILSFNRLIQRELTGWYNMFYLTLFHTFFILVLFNIYSLVALLASWYILFAIRPRFK
jgi:hypothetical protein